MISSAKKHGKIRPVNAENCGHGDVNMNDTERLVSGVTGASLLAAGMVKRSFAGLVLTAIGAGLVYRGVSGKCGLYKMLGIRTNCRDGFYSEKRIHEEELIDESLDESFPASDPPSSSAVTR